MSPIGWSKGIIASSSSGGGGAPISTSAQLSFSGQHNASYNISPGLNYILDAENGNGGTGWHNITFTVDRDIALQIHMWGAGGGGTKRSGGQTGGGGGYSTGTYIFQAGVSYQIYVGGAGEGGSQSPGNNTGYNAKNTGI